MTTAISVSGLVKTFGATRALDGLDLTVSTGEVAGAVVAIPTKLPALAGIFGETASSVLSAVGPVGPGASALTH